MQLELLLEDLQLLAGDATLSSLTFLLNLTFPPVGWMANREEKLTLKRQVWEHQGKESWW